LLNQLESGAAESTPLDKAFPEGEVVRQGETPAQPLGGIVVLPTAGQESFASSRPNQRVGRSQTRLFPAIVSSGVLLALLLVFAYQQTMYGPILKRQVQLAAGAAAEAESRWSPAEAAYRAAAAADPYSAEPWFRLASLDQQLALAEASPDRLQRFEQAIAEIARRNPHSQVAWKQIGDWRLALYRVTADRVQLLGAIDAYTQCVQLYPNGNSVHAQLAWVYHVAGNRERAAAEAQEALRLDARNPHRERALAQQQLFDPQVDELRAENAEQCMQRLRR
jgi:hypothetical protein